MVLSVCYPYQLALEYLESAMLRPLRVICINEDLRLPPATHEPRQTKLNLGSSDHHTITPRRRFLV